ncbi:twinkle protein, mitochondrial [Lates japonicus]|uniref:Twinkle protein, mitochondrial n=1 Tax=Lates japonicus TaxID=270547 RepID=A0AAD3MUT2_LATJO|nr:twinkle protein, mitochondrial [Lates japonicus]
MWSLLLKAPLSLADIKQYTHGSDIPFHDGYSCLHIPSILGRSIVQEGWPLLFIDKTRAVSVPDLSLWRGWRSQDCLGDAEKEAGLPQPHVMLGCRGLEERRREERRQELQDLVQRCAFNDLPRMTQLVKTIFQSIAEFQARVTHGWDDIRSGRRQRSFLRKLVQAPPVRREDSPVSWALAAGEGQAASSRLHPRRQG